MSAEGHTGLEGLERPFTGGDTPMDPLNYLHQYRWQRIWAAERLPPAM